MLEIQNLTKIYRRSHLGKTFATVGVQNLSLSLKEGEIFALLGLNGAGKTTTIKLILGLLFPDAGQIRLWDKTLPDPGPPGNFGFLPGWP